MFLFKNLMFFKGFLFLAEIRKKQEQVEDTRSNWALRKML